MTKVEITHKEAHDIFRIGLKLLMQLGYTEAALKGYIEEEYK
jgi:hypothetical protein